MTPKPITWISYHIGDDPNSTLFLVSIRVVPTAQKGNTVIGRSLNYGESDDGRGIERRLGGRVLFLPGSLKITIDDVDRNNTPGSDGYAPLANTIWTWLTTGPSPDETIFYYLFAVARRMDTAHKLCVASINLLSGRPDISSLPGRAQLFEAFGYAEMMCVAFNRAIEMIRCVPSQFSSSVAAPSSITALFPALTEIRNSFEHIEDRAMGQVRNKPHQDAISIFHQPDFFKSGVLRYASHSLDLVKEVLPALVAGRQYIFDVAVEKSGPSIVINQPIELGPFTEQSLLDP